MSTQKDSILSDVRLLREYNDKLAAFRAASDRAFARMEHYQREYHDLMDVVFRFKFLIIDTERKMAENGKKE